MSKSDNVLREYDPIGKYRIRVLETDKGHVLDIREYVKDSSFEGFTRRGIRLPLGSDTDALTRVLTELKRSKR
jgi:hypothetical protein